MVEQLPEAYEESDDLFWPPKRWRPFLTPKKVTTFFDHQKGDDLFSEKWKSDDLFFRESGLEDLKTRKVHTYCWVLVLGKKPRVT